MIPFLTIFVFAALYILFRSKPWRIGGREEGLPPGPPTKPIIGNAAQIPRVFPYFHFMKWAQAYGEIFSLKVLNQTIVVLSSPASVKAILDKQGLATGNRINTYLTRMVEQDYLVTENMDSHVWRAGRKAIHQFLGTEALSAHWPTQQAEFSQFMHDVLDSPEKFYTHVNRTMASLVTNLVYGKRLPKYKGTEAEKIFQATQLWSEINDPTAHPPIDIFPFLKYVPSRWAPWKDLCRRTSTLRERLYGSLFAQCEQKMMSGNHTGAYLERVLQNLDELNMSRNQAKALGKVLIDAGAQTATDFIHSMAAILLHYPECQQQAHAELDRVVGGDRLPTMDDLSNLPYLNALIKEVHRFRPVAPLGIPHVTSQDIKYKEYLIPEGSMIIVNLWGIYHDPKFFDDPEVFEPERYLKSEFGTRTDVKVDVDGFRDSLPFGAGRRICPGAEMASKTIAMNAMNLLWAFDFSKNDSGTGSISLDAYRKPGVELSPMPFTCRIVVRDQKREALIRKWYSQTSTQEMEGLDPESRRI